MKRENNLEFLIIMFSAMLLWYNSTSETKIQIMKKYIKTKQECIISKKLEDWFFRGSKKDKKKRKNRA
jgi:hypothetical protein